LRFLGNSRPAQVGDGHRGLSRRSPLRPDSSVGPKTQNYKRRPIAICSQLELWRSRRVICSTNKSEDVMGFGRGLLLWLLGIPLPIIILLAIFMHH